MCTTDSLDSYHRLGSWLSGNQEDVTDKGGLFSIHINSCIRQKVHLQCNFKSRATHAGCLQWFHTSSMLHTNMPHDAEGEWNFPYKIKGEDGNRNWKKIKCFVQVVEHQLIAIPLSSHSILNLFMGIGKMVLAQSRVGKYTSSATQWKSSSEGKM